MKIKDLGRCPDTMRDLGRLRRPARSHGLVMSACGRFEENQQVLLGNIPVEGKLFVALFIPSFPAGVPSVPTLP